jgi:maltose/moltooligosaccharide transporter
MVGVGIAWASVLSMPYAMLSSALPAARMGVYMGIFNFFIVIPEILAALTFGPVSRTLFGQGNPSAPLYFVVIGGACFIVAALLVTRVDDAVGEAGGGVVLPAGAHTSIEAPSAAAHT